MPAPRPCSCITEVRARATLRPVIQALGGAVLDCRRDLMRGGSPASSTDASAGVWPPWCRADSGRYELQEHLLNRALARSCTDAPICPMWPHRKASNEGWKKPGRAFRAGKMPYVDRGAMAAEKHRPRRDVFLTSGSSGGTGMDGRDTQAIDPGRRRREALTFLILAVLIWPFITVGVVAGWGFVVWMYYLFTGPPGPV